MFAGIVLLAILSGLVDVLPPPAAVLFALGAYVIAGILLALGLIRLEWPNRRAAERRVDALLEGDPATAQSDRPAASTPAADMLWRTHAARMANAAANLTLPAFDRQWRRIDRFRLRFVLPAACAAMAVVAGSDGPSRLRAALTPDPRALFPTPDVHAELWAVPPAYTGQPPATFLAGAIGTAPTGSELVLRVHSPGRPRLELLENGQLRNLRPQPGPDGVYELRGELGSDWNLTVHYWGERSRFTLKGLADHPPTASLAELRVGKADRVLADWSGEDDHGIVGARLEIARDDGEPIAVDLPLPAFDPASVEETSELDLLRHPYAGLEIEARVALVDAAGQTGRSRPIRFRLPEKLFVDPLARAAVEARGAILRTGEAYTSPPASGEDETVAVASANRIEHAPKAIRRAGWMLDALTRAPEDFFDDAMLFLGLRYARAILNNADGIEEAKRAGDVLWKTALRAEYGSLAKARRAIEAIAEALEQAMRDGASDEEIAELIERLRAAVDRYLQALASQPAGEAGEAGEAAEAIPVERQTLNDLLEAIQEFSETGARDRARDLLANVRRLLDQLQSAQASPRRGDGNGQGAPSNPSPGERGGRMEQLGELLREQRALSDETFARSRGENAPGRDGERNPGQQPGNSPGGGLDEQQRDLAERLRSLRDGFETGDEAAGAGPPLDEAVEAQLRASEALRRGDIDEAMAEQRLAMARLRETITSLAELADRERGVDEARGGARDPLDREAGVIGTGIEDGTEVEPGQALPRALEFLEELRSRSSRPDLPRADLEYLQRLLDRF